MICYYPGKTIQELWNEFTEKYPYLRLEIIETLTPELFTGNNLESTIHGATGDPCQISILPVHSIREVENVFLDHLNLKIKVSRKLKDGWIATTTTFFLSLETQNELGRLSSQQ